MNRYTALFVSVVLLAGCAAAAKEPPTGGNEMKVLTIRWQRLVDEKGRTCDRCGATETAVEDAIGGLSRSLKELGVDVALEKATLDPKTFSGDPLQSNRIWVGGRPIEEWLQASVGQSPCCSTCGDSDCRTLTVDGRTYEDIPAELIVKAGLLAGAQMLGEKPSDPCCPPAASPPKKTKCCPPAAEQKAR